MTTATRPGMLGAPVLPAATPAQWLATHLEAHLAAHETGPVDPATRTWADERAVLADGAAMLRDAHARVLAGGGGTSQMAAKWVVGWSAGAVADESRR